MTHVFNDKADVSIFFSLSIMMFTELFFGVINMNLYNNPENREWYGAISKKIKGMPRRIVFPIAWVILYIGIHIGMFIYYRNESFPNNGYMIDTITLIFVTNVVLIKTWPWVFFQMRKTILSLIMNIVIVALTTVMTVLFGVWSQWGSFVPFLVLTLWSCYALYLNALWVYVESHYLILDNGRRGI